MLWTCTITAEVRQKSSRCYETVCSVIFPGRILIIRLRCKESHQLWNSLGSSRIMFRNKWDNPFVWLWTLILTNPRVGYTAICIIPFPIWVVELHTVLASTVGLPAYPESASWQVSPIYPPPLSLFQCVRQTNPGPAVKFGDKIQFIVGGWDRQVCSSLQAVFSAVFPGFSRSFLRGIVALVIEFEPSLVAKFF